MAAQPLSKIELTFECANLPNLGTLSHTHPEHVIIQIGVRDLHVAPAVAARAVSGQFPPLPYLPTFSVSHLSLEGFLF